ncbi:hypothetical protein NFI96_030492 [Prochilodus magdalenae]|nr:hypothetical protein NFI96_030492 [Prochilodus magdalenae]
MLESSFWQGLMSVDRNDVSIPDVLCDSHDDMGESEVQKISSAITAVFPDLPVAVLNSVIDTLKALGAETTDDLQYITEEDLLPVLKPIQARRLIVSWAQNSSSCFTAGTIILSIDQEVVNDHIISFVPAFCLLFGSYYCFNIHYPTLEFLQS